MLATVSTSPVATLLSLVSMATACVDNDSFSNARVVSSSSTDSSSAYKCNVDHWYFSRNDEELAAARVNSAG